MIARLITVLVGKAFAQLVVKVYRVVAATATAASAVAAPVGGAVVSGISVPR